MSFATMRQEPQALTDAPRGAVGKDWPILWRLCPARLQERKEEEKGYACKTGKNALVYLYKPRRLPLDVIRQFRSPPFSANNPRYPGSGLARPRFFSRQELVHEHGEGIHVGGWGDPWREVFVCVGMNLGCDVCGLAFFHSAFNPRTPEPA